MTKAPITIRANDTLEAAVGRMDRNKVKRLVVTGDDTEEDFLATVQRAVARWESGCQVIVGRAGNRRADTGPLVGFSVMLHGVSPAVSLRAQAEGVGGYRKLGCGVFVPHRSADAVAT